MTEEKNCEKKAVKKSVSRRITGIVGYILIFLIAALFITAVSFKANNKTMFVFGKAIVWVMTPSMEPDIPARSYILVSKVDPVDVKEGDIIMFKSKELGGANNTHEVIKIEDGLFYTKGKANPVPDATPTEAKDIVARYEKNLPVLSALGRFLFSGIGTIITITLVFVIMMIMYLPDIIRATRERSKLLEEKRQAKIDELIRAEVQRLKEENIAVTEPEQTVQEPKDGSPTEQGEISEQNASSQETASQENEQ